jgi:hypothetical protein
MLSSDAFFWSPLDLLAYVAARARALSMSLMSTLRRGIAGDGACVLFFFFFFSCCSSDQIALACCGSPAGRPVGI